ncbi:M42 family metallopeptidase [Gorillibacterium timonense]|uniref:M42 family metallopeptidase n=1 Tax=Gorillibacterium timonense TaxID=1689269 RepID=UPI00071E39BE|nr:M42 family metallopeptidase [Gorillibacterium timonense]
MDKVTEQMKKLTELDGISGDEREVGRELENLLAPHADEVVRDRLGSVFGKKAGKVSGPKILLAGHLDEVGFMVTQITEGGYLRFTPVGGWWSHNLLSQRVAVRTEQGKLLGLIGSKAPHLLTNEERAKVILLKELFVDIGASSRAEAEEMGVRVGDPVSPVSEFTTLRNGELWMGKALDNRAGCLLAAEVLRRLSEEGISHPNEVYAGGTVQEEVGLRGAATAARMIEPDIAFALDVCTSYDTPGMESYAGSCGIGKGPVLSVLDSTMIAHRGLLKLVTDTAKELSIPLQFETSMAGGTDAGRFHINGAGCPSLALGFAVRYLHSHNSVMAKQDFEQAADLMVAVIRKLDRTAVEAILR